MVWNTHKRTTNYTGNSAHHQWAEFDVSATIREETLFATISTLCKAPDMSVINSWLCCFSSRIFAVDFVHSTWQLWPSDQNEYHFCVESTCTCLLIDRNTVRGILCPIISNTHGTCLNVLITESYELGDVFTHSFSTIPQCFTVWFLLSGMNIHNTPLALKMTLTSLYPAFVPWILCWFHWTIRTKRVDLSTSLLVHRSVHD